MPVLRLSKVAVPDMRIVELVNNLQFGGVERQVVDIAEAFQSRGHDVRVICLRGSGPLEERLLQRGMEVLPLLKKEGPDIGVFLRLAEYLRRNKIDVVHSHNPLVHHYAVVASRLAGTPVVVNTIHGINNIASPPGFAERLYALMVRWSDAAVAVCPMATRTFLAGGVIPADKLLTINNGIPQEEYLRLAPPSPGAQGLVFGIVGRLVPIKDHASLLNAFKILLGSHPSSKLRILGDGPLRGSLEKQAADLGIQHAVNFVGYSADVPGFLTAVDVAVLTSVSEGLPLSVLEAMAAARPVVGTSVGGMADLIEEGETGWLCPPSDPVRLASALRIAAESGSDRLVAMGSKARGLVEQHYSLERMIVEYEAMFRAIRLRKGHGA